MTEPWPDPRFRELSASTLASISADEIGPAVVQHVHWLRASGLDEARALDQLPPGMRAIYATWVVDAEVLHGGFNQFFFNRKRVFAGEALGGYEMLSAEDYADVMRAAIATFEVERPALSAYHESGSLEAFGESYEHTKLGEV